MRKRVKIIKTRDNIWWWFCFAYCAVLLACCSLALLFSNTRSDKHTHARTLMGGERGVGRGQGHGECLYTCVQISLQKRTCGRKWIKWLEPPKNDKFNRKSLHVNALIGHNPIMAQGYALAVPVPHSIFVPLTRAPIERCVKNMATHPFVFRVFVYLRVCGCVPVSHFIFMPAHVLLLFLLSSFLFARLMFVLCFSERFYLRLSVAHFPLFRRRLRLAFDKWLLACQSADLGFDFGIQDSSLWWVVGAATPLEDPKLPIPTQTHTTPLYRFTFDKNSIYCIIFTLQTAPTDCRITGLLDVRWRLCGCWPQWWCHNNGRR